MGCLRIFIYVSGQENLETVHVTVVVHYTKMLQIKNNATLPLKIFSLEPALVIKDDNLKSSNVLSFIK